MNKLIYKYIYYIDVIYQRASFPVEMLFVVQNADHYSLYCYNIITVHRAWVLLCEVRLIFNTSVSVPVPVAFKYVISLCVDVVIILCICYLG